MLSPAENSSCFGNTNFGYSAEFMQLLQASSSSVCIHIVLATLPWYSCERSYLFSPIQPQYKQDLSYECDN